MSAQYTIGEGVTDPIIFQLLSIDPDTDDGTPVDLTGVTLVDMRIISEDQGTSFNYLDSGAQLAITDVPTGQVTFTPVGTEFLASEDWYNAHFLVTDAAAAVVRFPSDGSFQIEVIAAY